MPARSLGALAFVLAVLGSACLGAHTSERRQSFEDQGAVVSPHDEAGGRFDGASISPGFGVLYLHGYSNEGADQPACGGYFGEAPEHVLEVAHAAHFKIVVHSGTVLVMGLKGPDGDVVCGGDPSAVNANVSLTQDFAPGRYEVWVGTRQRHTSTGYRLVLSE